MSMSTRCKLLTLALGCGMLIIGLAATGMGAVVYSAPWAGGKQLLPSPNMAAGVLGAAHTAQSHVTGSWTPLRQLQAPVHPQEPSPAALLTTQLQLVSDNAPNDAASPSPITLTITRDRVVVAVPLAAFSIGLYFAWKWMGRCTLGADAKTPGTPAGATVTRSASTGDVDRRTTMAGDAVRRSASVGDAEARGAVDVELAVASC